MDLHFHRLPDLFHQLGLPNEPAAIEHFIATHRPLARIAKLCTPFP